jgi:hypothetical protein
MADDQAFYGSPESQSFFGFLLFSSELLFLFSELL